MDTHNTKKKNEKEEEERKRTQTFTGSLTKQIEVLLFKFIENFKVRLQRKKDAFFVSSSSL